MARVCAAGFRNLRREYLCVKKHSLFQGRAPVAGCHEGLAAHAVGRAGTLNEDAERHGIAAERERGARHAFTPDHRNLRLFPVAGIRDD